MPKVPRIDDIVSEIESGNLPASRLEELSSHRSKRVRAAVAESPSAPDSLVERLASSSDKEVRLAAACNARSRPCIEMALARSEDRSVRAILAHTYAEDALKLALARDVQVILAADEWWEVRGRIAETTNQRDIFEQLMQDEHVRVRGACAENPRLTPKDRATLMADKRKEVRAMTVEAGIGKGPILSNYKAAALDESSDVRWAALEAAGWEGPETVREIAEMLKDDRDMLVRQQAREYLQGK